MDIVSIIIEFISAIATLAAVIVALSANKKSNEQLKKAIEMHEQSKNISLFEKRLSLLNAMLNSGTASTVSPDEVELLFNDEIKKLFKVKLRFLQKEEDIEFNITNYFDALAQSRMIEGNVQSVRQRFVEQEMLAEEHEEYENQYLQFCKKHELTIDNRVCNFSLMSEELGKIGQKIKKADENINTAGKEFIRQSIKALDQR